MTPQFTHDCDRCVFVGHFVADGQHYDLYHCGQHGNATVIGRFSDAGPDYTSGMCFSFGLSPVLTEAILQAKVQGIRAYHLAEALFYLKDTCPDYADLLAEAREAQPFALLKLVKDPDAMTFAEEHLDLLKALMADILLEYPHLLTKPPASLAHSVTDRLSLWMRTFPTEFVKYADMAYLTEDLYSLAQEVHVANGGHAIPEPAEDCDN